jgi:hypothetical protein
MNLPRSKQHGMEKVASLWKCAEPYDAFGVGREPGGPQSGSACGGSVLGVDAHDGEHLLPVAGGVVAA